ncbi:hypothetical protein B0H10DRAFT_2212011 [Mycena sp. CBHHK59/15]|nr:hypothetical protein B0H10DRAFT_2212011 [Mycena sp. CBHHK59/15]
MPESVPFLAIDTQSGPDTLQFSVFPIMLKPKLTRAKRTAPPVEAFSDAKDFEIMGPIEANTDMAWDDSVDNLAGLLGASSEFLVVSSMEWHWLKPQNSAWLPHHTESGYNSLIKQCLSPPKNVSPSYIIIKIDPLMKSPPSQSMPWASQQAAGPSSGPGAFEVLTCAIVGFKKIVWAAAMKNGTSTIFGPPLGSNHFSMKAALKKAVPATVSATSAKAPALAPFAQPCATPFPNPYAYPPVAS